MERVTITHTMTRLAMLGSTEMLCRGTTILWITFAALEGTSALICVPSGGRLDNLGTDLEALVHGTKLGRDLQNQIRLLTMGCRNICGIVGINT